MDENSLMRGVKSKIKSNLQLHDNSAHVPLKGEAITVVHRREGVILVEKKKIKKESSISQNWASYLMQNLVEVTSNVNERVPFAHQLGKSM